MLEVYNKLWNAAFSSKYIDLYDLDKAIFENKATGKPVVYSINTIGRACEVLMETWLYNKGWDTKLIKQDNFI